MELIEAILKRRSIRKFKPSKISEAQIQEIIKAGMYAPSAGNEKPWHFVVIEDRKTLDAIAERHQYAKMARDASIAIMICCDEKLVKYPAYWQQDCAAATQNVLLAVHAKGLGAVWVGIYPREDRLALFRELVPLPENVIPFSLIPIGEPDESPQAEERFDPSRIHQGQW